MPIRSLPHRLWSRRASSRMPPFQTSCQACPQSSYHIPPITTPLAASAVIGSRWCGAGQSALETAALLHEAGADALLVVRRPAISWLDPNPERLSRLGHLKRPVTQLCEGWHCAFWNSPAAFRLLPQDVRITKARTVLGPAGAWWLKERVEGVVELLAGHRVLNAVPNGNGVHLVLDGPSRTTLDVDHVIAGTGFRVDVARLQFLSEALRATLATLNGHPVVSRAAESTVPGLYFVGAPAAVSLQAVHAIHRGRL